MDTILLGLIQLDSPNPKTKAFFNRIFKHRENLLRFLDHREAEFHNNRAERTIRPAVIFRKTSFENRTPEGAYLYSIFTSVIETYRLKNKSINKFLKKVYYTTINKMERLTGERIDTSKKVCMDQNKIKHLTISTSHTQLNCYVPAPLFPHFIS